MRLALQPGEKILAGIRKHWLVFSFETIGIVIAALLPVIFFGPATSFLKEIFELPATGQSDAAALFLLGVWELLMFIIFFIILTNYYLDIVIITNKRVIDVDQLSLFARDIASTPIENVEDVKIEVLGVLATLFKFGNLHVQTAGQMRETVISGVRHPERAKDLIMGAYHVDKHEPQ
jgi:LPXTG-motif cell wall-anchored protein